MNPSDFQLQPSGQTQPKLHDGECATRDWPMPPAKPFQPQPRELTLPEKWKLNTQRRLGV